MPASKPAPAIPPKPLLFYSNFSGAYYMQLDSRKFLALGDGAAKRHLRRAGLFAGQCLSGLNDVEAALCEAELERFVDYAGPLAGYRCGLVTTGAGTRLLVTSEARSSVFDVPKGRDDFPHLEAFLSELFGGKQLPYVLAWLKVGLDSLRRQDFRPGQLLVLAGPAACGKSLFQALVTELFGGRAADPYQYLTGETAFNADLAEAEHWAMEEATGSTDIRTRRKFADALKAATVGAVLRVHAKGRKAFSAQTFRRMSLSINDETECLLVLPPMDASIADKVILLRCSPAKVDADRTKTWKRLAGDLPALAAYLHRWRMPERMQDSRFGVKAYHNPDLLEQLGDTSPENRLLSLIDAAVDRWPWEGPALNLERLLRTEPDTGFAAANLFGTWGAACGSYLSKLRTKHPERFSCSKVNGQTHWRILRHQATP